MASSASQGSKPFVFEQKTKNILFAFMAIGAVSLAASYFDDPTGATHTRFWTNLLHNSAFYTLIAFTATFAIAATTLTYAGWHTAFKRVWESISMFLPFGLVGIFIVGAAGQAHIHHLYHWIGFDPSDKIIAGKAAFLNIGMYMLATIGFGGAWYFFARKFRSISLQQDADRATDISYPWYSKMKFWAGVFLPIAGFTSAAAIWLWLMSLDAHWYSTMFAWYTTASAWVTTVSLTILMLIYLKDKGYFEWVTIEHLHDLGKFLFAFSVFWTYLWFSQYMLIWYANIGEETIYFRARMGEFPVLFYGNLLLNFVLPLLILIRNDTKRKFGTLGFMSGLIFFGHWWDFFQIVKIGPYKSAMEHHGSEHGASHTEGAAHGAEHGGAAANHGAAGHAADAAHGAAGHAADAAHGTEHALAAVSETPAMDALEAINNESYFHYTPDMTGGFGIPGFWEIGTFLGFTALFIYVVFNQLSKALLLPQNDAYVEETLNHHVELHGDDHH
jgi:hypothetical protein